MKIDAHQHFWNVQTGHYPWLNRPENAPINRTFDPEMLAPFIRRAGIDRTVLVQAMDSYQDTESMLAFADQYDWIGGVVGWVPLDNPDEAERTLAQWVRHPKFKGVRHLIHEEADPDWVIQDRVIEGLSVLASFSLPFDVVAVFPNHIHHVPTLAERVPNLRMVIDHLAKPPIACGEIGPWQEKMARAARFPQVYAKVSGLNTAAKWGHWSHRDLEPYIDAAYQLFGSERLMFGSDWPVATLADDYQRVWEETLAVVTRYDTFTQEAILGRTAQLFYHIEEA